MKSDKPMKQQPEMLVINKAQKTGHPELLPRNSIPSGRCPSLICHFSFLGLGFLEEVHYYSNVAYGCLGEDLQLINALHSLVSRICYKSCKTVGVVFAFSNCNWCANQLGANLVMKNMGGIGVISVLSSQDRQA